MDFLLSSDFWIGLLEIVWINIILSGDNAVVIALAARALPVRQQRRAVLLGSGAAVVLRVVLTVVAAKLLSLPYLQIAGGLLLLWIGVQLMGEEAGPVDDGSKTQAGMAAAVRTILMADVVMSLDNVIAVAAAAAGNLVLLVLGLVISIPLVVFGSTLMINLMQRFPVIVVLGAALIGWVGGETVLSDAALKDVLDTAPWARYLSAAVGAALVLGIGKLRQKHAAA